MSNEHKAGFVNIIGNPNVGKSTLMNRLVGEKLSIITPKAQTTRHRIFGIINDDNFQIVVSDTPGIINPHYKLHKSMMNFVDTALQDADIVLYVTDIYDNPDKILKAAEIIDFAWMKCYSNLREIIKASGQIGHGAWLGLWCETSYYPLQCDFAAMISPDDFERFVMPSMIRTCNFLDHSVFHLDGPDCIVHLDHLLSLSRLDGIQWVPGDGSSPVWDDIWFPLYEKIQAADKNLVINGVNTTDNVLKLCKNLSSKGLFITISLDSTEEACELIKEVKGIY